MQLTDLYSYHAACSFAHNLPEDLAKRNYA